MKLAIIGSRTFEDYDLLCSSIRANYNIDDIEAIVSGAAKGADSLGAKFAHDNEIPLMEFPAEWKKYGKRAGFIRNHDIIKNCTHCIAFWDGESHGTQHSISLCQEQNKPYIVVPFTPTEQ